MELHKDFKEFIALLNEHQVKYLVVGGYAVNLHGYPRYTKDIDIWLWTDSDNANNLLQVLDDFGFTGIGLTAEDLMNPDNIIQLGYEPYRIDLIIDIEGLTFEDCFERKTEVELAETKKRTPQITGSLKYQAYGFSSIKK